MTFLLWTRKNIFVSRIHSFPTTKRGLKRRQVFVRETPGEFQFPLASTSVSLILFLSFQHLHRISWHRGKAYILLFLWEPKWSRSWRCLILDKWRFAMDCRLTLLPTEVYTQGPGGSSAMALFNELGMYCPPGSSLKVYRLSQALAISYHRTKQSIIYIHGIQMPISSS